VGALRGRVCIITTIYASIRWAVLLARIYTDPSDPSPGFDPAVPEPVPEFEFDQSVPDEFDFQA
jgi:hypothetical protein